MKLDITTFSKNKVESTEDIKKTISFGFAKDAQKMVFTIFTKSLYSNPIGSIVREITSNCFDSHKEANIDEPVRVVLTKENNQHYISFIDVGVGMSYERITTVYSEYFNSTKRDDENQIGGFGIGGKTPLAYNSESFYLITNFNGVRYIYLVYKGENSPDIDPLSEEPTTEHNGTTIKIPVKNTDVSTFEHEINRQLYYFENVIFEGFSSDIKNDYTIYSGNHFLYRGLDYSSRMHICLGQVAYPIDYSALGLIEGDFMVPVALKFNIGEINVTASRENLDYNDETKKIIKKKIELVKNELKTMILSQYSNISSLEDYYITKKNFGLLTIDKEKGLSIRLSGVVSANELIYPKLGDIKIPSADTLIDIILEKKIMGKKKKKDSAWNGELFTMNMWKNIYYINNDTPKNRRTQSWLKVQHEFYHFVSPKTDVIEDNLNLLERVMLNGEIVDPKAIDLDIRTSMNEIRDELIPNGINPSKKIFNQIRLLFQEALDIITKNSIRYSDLKVPADFVMLRNNDFGALLNRNIKLRFTTGSYSYRYRCRCVQVLFKDLLSYKGTIVYCLRDDETSMISHISLLRELKLVREKEIFRLIDSNDSIRFVILNKNTIGLMKHLKNAIPYTEVYEKFIFKKRDYILTIFENKKFVERYNNTNTLFFNKALTSVDKKLKLHTDILIKNYEKVKECQNVSLNVDLNKLKIDLQKIKSGYDKHFNYIEDQAAKNKMIHYVNIPTWDDATKNKELMELVNLVYKK